MQALTADFSVQLQQAILPTLLKSSLAKKLIRKKYLLRLKLKILVLMKQKSDSTTELQLK